MTDRDRPCYTGVMIKELVKKYNDLKIQAMMFDMDVDIETLTLTPKVKNTQPIWVRRWQEKQAESDYTVYDNGN